MRTVKFLILPVFAVMFCVSCLNGSLGNPGSITPAEGGSEYVVFAWNDLGMHCLNPGYDTAVILPPYNTIECQVVKRGNPPQLVTDAVVEYELADNTYSYGKGEYGQFWDHMDALFGVTKAHDIGLADKGLSGTMDWDVASGAYRAVGIPVVPRTDSAPDVRAPYQQALILVKSSTGLALGTTKATVPTSDEINCAKCHGSGTVTSAFEAILASHDAAVDTVLAGSTPVLCASCHSSPALGTPVNGTIPYLSAAIHGFHSDKGASCLDCHPGQTTKCNRSLAHTAADGNCQSCHGSMAEVASSITDLATQRVPWLGEPECAGCHTSSTGITPVVAVPGSTSAIPDVDTGSGLYRNAVGHGGLRCVSCHGSPHAMVPSREAKDNYQAIGYQGVAVTIGSCAVCHGSSHGEGAGEFMEKHGGTNPEEFSACAVCHTAVPSGNTVLWPHEFKWKAR